VGIIDMEDDEDIWANTASSPSASPPQPVAAGSVSTCSAFISTQLSLNSRLHLLSSAAAGGGSSPVRGGAYGADGVRHHHMALGGGFRNAAASQGSFFPYNLAGAGADVAPFDGGRGVLEDDLSVGAAASGTWAGGGTDRRKKRMIKNRESAARSRARKQAYVRELETKVQLLQQENESLRVKYDEVSGTSRAPGPGPSYIWSLCSKLARGLGSCGSPWRWRCRW
jgi:plasmid stabilization system protein ParE